MRWNGFQGRGCVAFCARARVCVLCGYVCVCVIVVCCVCICVCMYVYGRCSTSTYLPLVLLALLLKRLQDSPTGGAVGGPGHSHPHPRPQRHRESPTFPRSPRAQTPCAGPYIGVGTTPQRVKSRFSPLTPCTTNAHLFLQMLLACLWLNEVVHSFPPVCRYVIATRWVSAAMLQPGPNFLELIHSARCTGNDIFLSLWRSGVRLAQG